MSNYQYAQLCQMLQEIGESLEQSEPACNFSEDEVAFDNDNYSELWEDRS